MYDLSFFLKKEGIPRTDRLYNPCLLIGRTYIIYVTYSKVKGEKVGVR